MKYLYACNPKRRLAIRQKRIIVFLTAHAGKAVTKERSLNFSENRKEVYFPWN
jgi:hypothetical protein